MWEIAGIVAGILAGVATRKKLSRKAVIGVGFAAATIVGSAVYTGAYWAYVIGIGVGVVTLFVVGLGVDEKSGIIMGAIMTVLIGGIIYADSYYNQKVQACVVNEKDRGGSDNGYRVYTSCGVFDNSNNWLRGKFHSGELWDQIHVGDTLVIERVGSRRFVFWDTYPNILSVKPA